MTFFRRSLVALLTLLTVAASASTAPGCYVCEREERYNYIWYERCQQVSDNSSGTGIYCKERYTSLGSSIPGTSEQYYTCTTSGGACYYIVVTLGAGAAKTQQSSRHSAARRVVHIY